MRKTMLLRGCFYGLGLFLLPAKGLLLLLPFNILPVVGRSVQSAAHDAGNLADTKPEHDSQHDASEGEPRHRGKEQGGNGEPDAAGFGIAVGILSLLRHGMYPPTPSGKHKFTIKNHYITIAP